MRMIASVLRLSAALLLLVGSAGVLPAADATFVGKLALLDDAEVVKELGLTDESKKKLLDLVDKRMQEAIGVAAKLKGKPQAEVAAGLAPFVADSEKLGKALLDDNQWAKLQKLQIAKDGMLGVLSAEMADRLQLAEDQK